MNNNQITQESDNKIEVWKPIEGYENLYEVSNLGKVRRIHNNYNYSILNPVIDKKGNNKVWLSKCSEQKACRVHILVAKAFVLNPNNFCKVFHKNLNKSDNRAENLEWQDLIKNIKLKEYLDSLPELELPGEIWKDVIDFEGVYQVSNKGRIKRLEKKIDNMWGLKSVKRLIFPKFLLNEKGYIKVSLSNNGIEKKYKLHRLIAQAFIPNLENKPEINHKNGNKLDNRIENLEWVTRKEQIDHAKRLGLFTNKLNDDIVRQIKLEYKNNSNITFDKLGDKYNVVGSTIRCIIRNIWWKHVTI